MGPQSTRKAQKRQYNTQSFALLRKRNGFLPASMTELRYLRKVTRTSRTAPGACWLAAHQGMDATNTMRQRPRTRTGVQSC